MGIEQEGTDGKPCETLVDERARRTDPSRHPNGGSQCPHNCGIARIFVCDRERVRTSYAEQRFAGSTIRTRARKTSLAPELTLVTELLTSGELAGVLKTSKVSEACTLLGGCRCAREKGKPRPVKLICQGVAAWKGETFLAADARLLTFHASIDSTTRWQKRGLRKVLNFQKATELCTRSIIWALVQ